MRNYLVVESKVADPTGLHTRPLDAISNIASVNLGRVLLYHLGREANAKSIFQMMSLGIGYNERVSILVEVGPFSLPCSRALDRAIRDPHLTDRFDEYITQAELIRGPETAIVF